jgi:hypothetical protein
MSAMQFTTIAFVLLCNLWLIPISWSKDLSEGCGKESFDSPSIHLGIALLQNPKVDPEAEQVAFSFVDNTLPRLLADDPVLAGQLGFTAQDLKTFRESGAILDSPLALYIVSLKDLRTFVKKQTLPLKLLTTDINLTDDFAPARFLFPIRLNNDATDSRGAKLSALVEKGPITSWRIHNAGGSRLIQAVKLYSTRKEDFIVWIPGINRHYLGRVGPTLRFTMTVLFDDPVARVNAGHEFDPCDSNVLDKLQQLDKLLQPLGKAADDANQSPSYSTGTHRR